jgi:hypothetical protein
VIFGKYFVIAHIFYFWIKLSLGFFEHFVNKNSLFVFKINFLLTISIRYFCVLCKQVHNRTNHLLRKQIMNKRPNKAQIQITDLIDESVDNAVARRQQALESEGFELDLSDDSNQDYSQIKGGIQSVRLLETPTIGLIYKTPEIQ